MTATMTIYLAFAKVGRKNHVGAAPNYEQGDFIDALPEPDGPAAGTAQLRDFGWVKVDGCPDDSVQWPVDEQKARRKDLCDNWLKGLGIGRAEGSMTCRMDWSKLASMKPSLASQIAVAKDRNATPHVSTIAELSVDELDSVMTPVNEEFIVTRNATEAAKKRESLDQEFEMLENASSAALDAVARNEQLAAGLPSGSHLAAWLLQESLRHAGAAEQASRSLETVSKDNEDAAKAIESRGATQAAMIARRKQGYAK